MPIRQMLLSLPSFPDAVPDRTLESACVLAQAAKARLTVQLPQLNSDRTTWPAAAGAFPVGFMQLMNELVVRSEANAMSAAQALDRLAKEYGLTLDLRRGLTTPYALPTELVDLSRLHDLVILPVPETDALGRHHVQAALFDSGRPVVLLPSAGKRLRRLDHVMVAWDYSREAARALFDALPLLAIANKVHVVTIFGERHIKTSSTSADLERLLAAHDVQYDLRRISLESENIGHCLSRQAEDLNADMLVMGAYGHSRLRELILGGATRAILAKPMLPTFLSH